MDPADFYSGVVVDAYARLRSATFASAPYAALVRTHGEPALEIGCGDGVPMLDLRAEGLDVDGVDSSLDMVRRCRENAAHRELQVDVFHQRVEDLALERRYATVYLAGPTFNLLVDDETAGRALRAIADHLLPQARAVVPLWVPEPTPAEELGVTRTALDEAGHELRYTPLAEVVDVQRRTRTTTTRYERASPTGVEVADREWIIHWHRPAGFAELCERAGLVVESLLDDVTGLPADEDAPAFTAVVARTATAG